jgi:mannitol-1-phosphate 5-dehydrogenase
MKAVLIGPGRIGCGFVGHVLASAGYELLVVGRSPIVEQLERARAYRVRLVERGSAVETEVSGVRALRASDPRAIDAIAEADLVCVSVGAANLPGLAHLLAAGLARHPRTVNVLAFENAPEAAAVLAAAVAEREPSAARHGFSGALVSRIVTRRLGDLHGSAPLTFVGDPAASFVVHGPSLRAPLPAIPHLRSVEDYEAWVQKKLFTFGAGHATTAYLGALKGYRYVHAAIRDPEIRARVLDAMEEGRRGLEARYGAELAGDREELEAIVARFENAALNDPIVRVGRDPLRKLGCADRLLGAARLAEAAGVLPSRLALAAAAALCFICPGDPSACLLQDRLGKVGAGAILQEVAGVAPESGLGKLITSLWARLGKDRAPDAQLLSLGRNQWSWSHRAAAVPLHLAAQAAAHAA